MKRRDRNEVQIGNLKSLHELTIVSNDLIESLFAVVHTVHLVDGQQNVFDAQQRSNKAVTFCLFHHAVAFTSVDQNHCQVSGRCTRCHVPSVLNVAGRIRDDEFSFGRRKVSIGDIDGNALLDFFFE